MTEKVIVKESVLSANTIAIVNTLPDKPRRGKLYYITETTGTQIANENDIEGLYFYNYTADEWVYLADSGDIADLQDDISDIEDDITDIEDDITDIQERYPLTWDNIS